MAEPRGFAGREVVGSDLRQQHPDAHRRAVDNANPYGLDTVVRHPYPEQRRAFGRRGDRNGDLGGIVGLRLRTFQILAFPGLRRISDGK